MKKQKNKQTKVSVSHLCSVSTRLIVPTYLLNCLKTSVLESTKIFARYLSRHVINKLNICSWTLRLLIGSKIFLTLKYSYSLADRSRDNFGNLQYFQDLKSLTHILSHTLSRLLLFTYMPDKFGLMFLNKLSLEYNDFKMQSLIL